MTGGDIINSVCVWVWCVRSKQAPTIPGQTVEPLALNVLLCQVMVSMVTLGQREGPAQEPDAEWLMPLRGFVQETLSSGAKLSQRHLHTLLETVWRMVITQRSRGKTVCVCLCGLSGCGYELTWCPHVWRPNRWCV